MTRYHFFASSKSPVMFTHSQDFFWLPGRRGGCSLPRPRKWSASEQSPASWKKMMPGIGWVRDGGKKFKVAKMFMPLLKNAPLLKTPCMPTAAQPLSPETDVRLLSFFTAVLHISPILPGIALPVLIPTTFSQLAHLGITGKSLVHY